MCIRALLNLSFLRKRKRGSSSKSVKRSLQIESLETRSLLAVLPAGFTDSVVIANQLSPLSEIQIDDTGRVWFGMVNGDIGVIENDVLLTSSAYHLAAKSGGDQGVLGMLLDRNFATNGYLYVYYTADDANPNNKLSRLQVNLTTRNSIVPGSEVVLLELPNLSSVGNPSFHMGGTLRQFADGTLVVGVGDHESPPSVQNVNLPYGKLLRVNPNGSPAVNNPFYNAADGITWSDYVWALGVRNPFAGDVDPITGRYFISDVGSIEFEEVNDATNPGQNFGWPLVEGPENDILYIDPYHSYDHTGNACAITAGAFYSGIAQQFPAAYQGKYFYSELCAGKIVTVDPNNPANVQDFATDLTLPLKIDFAPNGSMYYLDIATQSIHKIQFTSNALPDVIGQPTSVLSTVGGNATFQVSSSGTEPFSYQWQENSGAGFTNIAGATSSSFTRNAVSLSMNGFQYRAVVTNSFGSDTSSPAVLTVTTDTPPVLSMTLMSPRPTYRAGDVINFSGFANDIQDGVLPVSSLKWKIDFHHNVHWHSFRATTSGIGSGSFTIPLGGETASDVWYRVYFSATDSAGFTRSIFKDIFPELSDFSVDQTVPGSNILVDSQSFDAPVNRTGVVGQLRPVEVTASTPVVGGEAIFVQWLDGNQSRVRTLGTPIADTAYVALYGYTNATFQYTYLSDLTPVGTPINGWGPIEKDRSNGGIPLGDGGIININGTPYEKGLGVHANSDIKFALNGGFNRFATNVGLQNTIYTLGNVIARVYGDGVLLYDSGPITDLNPRAISVNVTGVNELRLVVDPNGSIDFDNVVWANAQLAKVIPASTASTQVYLSDLTPVGTPINGWGPYEKDMSIGGTAAGDGGTINVNGVLFTKGLGVHSDSDIRYSLNGQYSRFSSEIGLHALAHPGNVVFRVFGDGVLLYDSGSITVANPKGLDLDVSGVNELQLIVDKNGVKDFDSAVWADARLTPIPASQPLGTYLSDLTPTGIPINGWGPYEKDMSVGGTAAGDGGTINLNGVLYTKGLGVHSDSDIRFNLNGQYDRFVSKLGLNGLSHPGNVIFQVYGDNVLLFDSGTVTVGNPKSINLSVAGIRELRLVVDKNGVKDFDSAVWADARLLPSPVTQPTIDYLSDLTPSGTPINGWGPYEKDTSIGGIAAGDGGTINVNGVLYAKGLGVHADSELRFTLNKQYDRFLTVAGLHSIDHAGSVIFRVYGDGILLYDSGVVTIANPKSLDLDVTGVTELRLVVDSNGMKDFDSAVWAGARVVSLGSTNPPPGGVMGAAVVVDGIPVRLLPYTTADATLDARLNEDDARAVANNLGPRPTNATFENWIRAGDLNLNGVTDTIDWDILNAAWLAKFGTTLDINNYLGTSFRTASVVAFGAETSTLQIETNTQPYYNASIPADVNGDRSVSPVDVLILINELKKSGSNVPLNAMAAPVDSPTMYFDTDGDQFLSPIDVLLVINELNKRSNIAEGESSLPKNRSEVIETVSNTLALPAYDLVEVEIDESLLTLLADDHLTVFASPSVSEGTKSKRSKKAH